MIHAALVFASEVITRKRLQSPCSEGVMLAYHSTRVGILRKVLDYINHDDWDEFEGFMIFGKGGFDIWTGVV